MAFSFFILVGAQIILISGVEGNTTNVAETYTPTMAIRNTMFSDSSTSMMSAATAVTENVTEINSTASPTTEAQSFPPHMTSGVTSSPSFYTTNLIKTTAKSRMMDRLTTPSPSEGSDKVAIIIIVVLLAIALLAAIVCYAARSKGRRYSVDFSSRPDDVQVPLSAVEREAPAETIALNGLQFEGTEGSTEEPQETVEPQEQPDDQTEQKAEPEKLTVEAGTESAALPADASEDQTNVPEQSPAAPVEPSGGENTADEGAGSKTPVESLTEGNEANENNSNSTVLPQRGARDAEAVWDTSLDNMV